MPKESGFFVYRKIMFGHIGGIEDLFEQMNFSNRRVKKSKKNLTFI